MFVEWQRAIAQKTIPAFPKPSLDKMLFVSKYPTVLSFDDRLLEFLRDDRKRTENHLQEIRAKYEGRTI